MRTRRLGRDQMASGSTPERRVLWAVTGPDLAALVRDAVPDADIRVVRRVAHLGGHGRTPGAGDVVVVAAGCGDGLDAVADAVARWAPTTTVVLVVADLTRLLDVHAAYLAAAAGDPRCDPRARVHVVTGQLTAVRLARVLAPRLAQPETPASPPLAVTPLGHACLRQPGKTTVAVLGCAGGAGTTTIATVLAAGLARRSPTARICVVKLSPRGDGHSATPAELAARPPRWQPDLGVHVLEGVAGGELVDGPGSSPVADLVCSLHRRFDVVVLDSPAAGPPPPADVPVDVVLLVTTLVWPSLAGLGRHAELLRERADALGGSAPSVGVVVNGALNGLGVDPPDVVETALGAPIVAAVPYAARDVAIATNTGRLDRLLDHPDLEPAYRRIVEHCPLDIPHAEPRHVQRRRRRPRRRSPTPDLAAVRSPFLLDAEDEPRGS